MAKFTLTFKGRFIETYSFEQGEISIGRALSNSISIDSLAVASTHAIVSLDSDGTNLKQANVSASILVNNQKRTEHNLIDGDVITIGKHTLLYSSKASPIPTEDKYFKELTAFATSNKESSETSNIAANLQILRGKNIGRIIPLNRAMTRLGKPGSGVAVIARRKDGFFISPLENNALIKLNKDEIGEESIKLQNGDTLEIEKNTLRFYLEDEK